MSRDLVRSGLGLTGAMVLASTLKDDDFAGAYDPRRAQIESLRNSKDNSFRIGNKWISVDWLGPLAVPFSAIMYARQYGKTGPEKGFQYARGVSKQALNLPGVKDAMEFGKSQSYKKDQTLEEATGESGAYLVKEASSRLIPSILSDIGKSFDHYERTSTAGADPLKKSFQSLQGKIPIVRESLPAKRDIFGDEIKTETGLTPLLFGSRVKENKETPLINEIRTVGDAVGKPINFTNWDKSSSKKLTQFKELVGPQVFDEAKIFYGQELKRRLEKLTNSPGYQKSSLEEQHKQINDADADAMRVAFRKYQFKYKKEKQ